MKVRFRLSALILLLLPSLLCGQEQLDRQTYPAWLDEAAIYHIFPPSFKDSDGDGIGDLQGIREKLDYIKELGFNTLWIGPVFCSTFTDAGYDITDYYRVDPRYGANEDMKALLFEAHTKGIRVCLDLVAGHTSDQHPWFRASSRGETPYKDWYIWTDGKGRKPKGKWVDNDYPRNGYYQKNYYDSQPALNYGYYKVNPQNSWEQPFEAEGPTAVREEIKRIIAFWFDMGADGFRCDMAWSLVKGDDKDFHGARRLWNDIFTWQGTHYPDRIFLSEWSSPVEAISAGFDIDIIRHNGCGKTMYRDLVYNTERDADPATGIYPPRDCWFDLAGKGRFDTFAVPFQQMYETTLGHGYPCMPTSSHDTWRLNRMQRSTPAELKTALTFFLTMPWVPIVYYGEEIGMRSLDGAPAVEGSRDRSAERTPMQWDDSPNAGFSVAPEEKLYLPVDPDANRPTVEAQLRDPRSLYAHVKRLLELRKEIPALSNRGGWRMVTSPEHPYPVVYERFYGDEHYLVALNPSGKSVSVQVDGFRKLNRRLGAFEKATENATGTLLTMGPASYVICKVEKSVRFTEAKDLTLLGKIIPTVNPYHRVDTMGKRLNKSENRLVRQSGGLMVAFRTDSPFIAVKTAFGEQQAQYSTTPISARGYDLYIRKDGQWLWAGAGVYKGADKEAAVVIAENLGNESKDCLLYLPLFSEERSVQIGTAEKTTIQSLKNPFRHKIALFGSSYTHGVSTSRPGMTYGAQLGRRAGWEILNLGLSGNSKLQMTFAEVLAASDADVFLIDAFSNPTPAEMKERLFPFIETLQQAHPGKPLIFQRSIYREKRNFNRRVDKSETAKLQMADSLMGIAMKRYKDVYYIRPDATSEDHETSVDGTHPGDYGYRLWERSLEKPLKKILRKYKIN